VSSLELETELSIHPSVATAAVVGVRSEHAEEEILAIIKPAPGHLVDFEELVEFLVPRVAYFMVPRYWRVMDEMPMTPTEKVRKVVLRGEGLTEDTWDREAAGIVLRADRIGSGSVR
jgi:crotonobetaine/carnitine-CoA ligase